MYTDHLFNKEVQYCALYGNILMDNNSAVVIKAF